MAQVPCMNGGNDSTSYSNNSLLQKTVIMKTKPVLEEAIKQLLKNLKSFPTCLKIADLGCSSGPNTLLLISQIPEIIHTFCQQIHKNPPDEFQVFLNDLPDNDFNTIFSSLPIFHHNLINNQTITGSCFISGTPGSFYERLFPRRSIHFVHSSYSLHWLSQVPEKLESNNKGNVYIAKSSPEIVLQAYAEQFQKDFSLFLSVRSEEIVCGGGMVLTFIGRNTVDPRSNDCCCLVGLVADSLLDLADEGIVEAKKVDSFNFPYYSPCEEEVKQIVEKEGSFSLHKLETFEVNWDPSADDVNNKEFVFNENQSGKNVANCIRAVSEPMLAAHFGKTVMDALFDRYANHVTQHLAVEKTKYINIVVSLTKIN